MEASMILNYSKKADVSSPNIFAAWQILVIWAWAIFMRTAK
jgi:hypothetical protein